MDQLLEYIASEWQYCTTIEETVSQEELVLLAKQALSPLFDKIETDYKQSHPDMTDPKKFEKGTDAECKIHFNKSKKQVIEHVVEAMKETITYLRDLIWEQRKLEEKEQQEKAIVERSNLKSPETAAATA